MKEVDKIKSLKKEIDASLYIIDELNSRLSIIQSPRLSDVKIKKHSQADDKIIQLEKIENAQKRHLSKIEKKQQEIFDILESIKDDEVRLIVTYRLKRLTYEQIGNRMGYSASGIKNKVYRYFENK